MLGGKTIKWERLQVRLDAAATYSGSGGTGLYGGYDGTLSSAFVTNTASTAIGIALRNISGSGGTYEFSFGIPALSISGIKSGATWYASSTNLVELVDVLLWETQLGLWRMSIGSVRWTVNGVLEGTYPGGTLDSGGLGPTYVPLLGLPLSLSGSVGHGHASMPSGIVTVSSEATAVFTGGYRFRETSGSPWVELPILRPTPDVPACWSSCAYCLGTGGIVGGSTTWDASINIYDSNVYTRQIFGSDYHSNQHLKSHGGRISIIPNLSKQVVKLGASDYAALIQRGGFPAAQYQGERGCIDATLPPPMPGSPPPVTTQTVNGQLHPQRSAMVGTVTSASHIIEEPLTWQTYAPVFLSRSEEQTGWIGEGPVPPGQENMSVPPTIGNSESVTYRFPSYVKPKAQQSDLFGFLNWDDGDHSPNSKGHIIRYVAYNAHPHWSFFYHPRDWNVDGGATSWDDYWAPLGQQHLTHPSLPSADDRKTRTSLVSAPLNDGGNKGFIENMAFGRKTSWWGICRFKTDVPTIPASKQLTNDSQPGWTVEDGTLTFEDTRIKVEF